MIFPSLESDTNGSPFGRQLRDGFTTLRFDATLEKDFRDYYLEFSRTRVQAAVGAVLALLLVLVGFDYVIASDGAQGGGHNVVRLAFLLPLVGMGILTLIHPDLRSHQQALFGFGATAFGCASSYIAVTGGVAGATHLFGAVVLLVMFINLFLGLLFHTALMASGTVALVYIAMGALLGLPGEVLFYQTVILIAAVGIGGVGVYTFEYAVRRGYLESRLLSELAQRDGLTGLYNRRLFDDQMSRIWRQARRERLPVQIILIDIDYFKVFNDLYGHQAGDDCLRKVAETLNAAAKRPLDLCARYGGEEFVLVLSDPPRDYAETLPERLRRQVAALGVPHEGSPVANVVTVSVGVAMVTPGEGRSLTGAVQMADEALYQAKEEGRNRVIFRESFSSITTGSFRAGRGSRSRASDAA
ncbi:MAG: GGDEF domain-containing protein [Gammaproteobacteria bacterium]|nr:GGDEF domain-containing protein [Gammaproteobacteria bacterium]TVQ50131.1 MAG: GGDEF domain-containing protein [Gammaproteobacteria bacterium]